MMAEASEKKRILLIDDDTSLLTTLSDFLSFEGYEVVTADSGEQGLKRLQSMEPDLIVLDMSMPGMGGVGFLKEISSDEGHPKYPVLVLTARANMAEFFSDVEVDGFVAKPCNPNDLLMEVSRIIFLRGGDEAMEEPVPGGMSRPAKLLLGEDDGGVRKRLAKGLQDAGYEVVEVAQGPEAVEKALIEKPDVIVLKLVFAGMNGDAVARMLREMPTTKGTPIVLYDDSSANEPESKYTEAGLGIRTLVRGSETASIVSAVSAELKAAE